MSTPPVPPYEDRPPPYTPYPTQPSADRQTSPYPPAAPSGFPQPYLTNRPYTYTYLDSPMSEYSSSGSSFDRLPGSSYGDGYDQMQRGQHGYDVTPAPYQPEPQQK